MNVLGIIPARKGSKGIPSKNSRMLGSRPLIAYTFATAQSCRSLTRVVLSTDSEEIAALGRAARIEVPFLRPAQYAKDNSPARDYIHHCLDTLEETEKYRPDMIVLLQPTAPFRQAHDVDRCVEMLRSSDADAVVSVSELPNKVHPQWQLLLGSDGSVRPFACEQWDQMATARQSLGPTYTRNGAVYAFWHATWADKGSLYGDRVLGYVMPPERSVNIDEMDDWRRAEEMLERGFAGEDRACARCIECGS